jgi:hypothetical protein
MKMKLISLSETSAGEFELILQTDGSVKKLPISIFEKNGIWGVEGADFEKLLWNSGSAEENQKLITEIKQKYLGLKGLSEPQAA